MIHTPFREGLHIELKLEILMLVCRSIKTLRNSETPATDEEITAAALQFVRKVTGFRQPSAANAEVFEAAVQQIARVTKETLGELKVARAR